MSILVDTNIHVIAPPELRSRYPLHIAPGTEDEFGEDQVNPPDSFLGLMDKSGLQQAYLMASRFHGFDNSYCADAVAAHPDRFVGVANVDILSPDAPERIRYWITERGMHGVRFWGGGPVAGHRFAGDQRGLAIWVDAPQYFAAWEQVLELGVPCNAQATMPEVLPKTRRLLERFPDLKLTLNNLAHVPPGQGASSQAAKDLLSLADYAHTYVNFSVGFMKQTLEDPAARELLVALIERYGAHRLIWSSFIRPLKDPPLSESVRIMHDGVAFLSQPDQDGVLGGGARNLYPALRSARPD